MKRTEQEYDWMEGCKYRQKSEENKLSRDFVRKPYAGTKAEPKNKPRLHGRGVV